MVTTKERSPMAASISAVAMIWVKAPAMTHGQNFNPGSGNGAPVANSKTARKTSAKGKPNRNRTWVAPTVPRLVVSSRCIALRRVCANAAMTVKTAQSQTDIMARTLRAILRDEHVIDVHIGCELPAVGEEIVNHAGLVGDLEPALLEGDFELVRRHELVPLMSAARQPAQDVF